MDALLKLLAKLNPKSSKSFAYKVMEWLVMLTMLYGVYASGSASLTAAKSNRDEQLRGYAVQMGINHAEIYALKEDAEQLRAWNKALSARINRLEDLALRRTEKYATTPN